MCSSLCEKSKTNFSHNVPTKKTSAGEKKKKSGWKKKGNCSFFIVSPLGYRRIWEFGQGKNFLASSVPEEVIDTDTKPSNPVDWTEHLFGVWVCVMEGSFHILLKRCGWRAEWRRDRGGRRRRVMKINNSGWTLKSVYLLFNFLNGISPLYRADINPFLCGICGIHQSAGQDTVL